MGGGITGLATALALAARPGADLGPAPSVVVLEATDHLGGKVRTESFCGLAVEAGPDSMLARVPEAVALCQQVGLGGDELVAPATGRAFVWSRGRLRPLPEGLVLGVPTDLVGLARSRSLSPAGLVRAAADLVLPARKSQRSGHDHDPSIAEAIGGRVGTQVVDRLVEPLLGGINAGPAERLSLAATAAEVAAVAAQSRSLLVGLRRQRRMSQRTGQQAYPHQAATSPVFLTVAGGLMRLVERLAHVLGDAGVEVHTGCPVSRLVPADGGGWRLQLATGEALVADAVVITTPAPAAAHLLSGVSEAAARELDSIEHASVATVLFAYRGEAVSHPLDGSGFLVPRNEGRLLTACTWVSSKWPALSPPGLVLLRASTGRADDDRFALLDDTELADRLHDELACAMGLTEGPIEHRVTRWPCAFPQYDVGHLARVGRIEAALAADGPGVVVAGAPYRGIGLAACIRQAQAAAQQIQTHLATTTSAAHP